MRLLPYHKLILLPQLSANEVFEILKNHTQPEYLSRTEKTKYFNGILSYEKFGIQKTVNYFRHLTPQINGRIVDEGGQTIVELIFKVPYYVIVSFFITSFICSGFAILLLIDHESGNIGFVIPLVILFINYFVEILFYNTEKTEALQFIKKILKIEK